MGGFFCHTQYNLWEKYKRNLFYFFSRRMSFLFFKTLDYKFNEDWRISQLKHCVDNMKNTKKRFNCPSNFWFAIYHLSSLKIKYRFIKHRELHCTYLIHINRCTAMIIDIYMNTKIFKMLVFIYLCVRESLSNNQLWWQNKGRKYVVIS